MSGPACASCPDFFISAAGLLQAQEPDRHAWMCLILVKRVGDELTRTDELTILAGHGALSAFKKQGHGSQHVAGRGLAPEVLTPV